MTDQNKKTCVEMTSSQNQKERKDEHESPSEIHGNKLILTIVESYIYNIDYN